MLLILVLGTSTLHSSLLSFFIPRLMGLGRDEKTNSSNWGLADSNRAHSPWLRESKLVLSSPVNIKWRKGRECQAGGSYSDPFYFQIAHLSHLNFFREGGSWPPLCPPYLAAEPSACSYGALPQLSSPHNTPAPCSLCRVLPPFTPAFHPGHVIRGSNF